MESIYNSSAFYYVVLCGFVGYGIYYMYGITKYFMKNQEVRRQFLSTHKKEEVRSKNAYTVWMGLFAFFIAYCVYSVLTISADGEQGPWLRLAFLFVGIVLVGQALLTIVKRRILFADDGFAYEDGVFRWQSVLSLEPQKKALIRTVDMLVTSGKHYILPREIGQAAHEEQMSFKKRKKQGKLA